MLTGREAASLKAANRDAAYKCNSSLNKQRNRIWKLKKRLLSVAPCLWYFFKLKPYLAKYSFKTLFNKTYIKLNHYLNNYYKYFNFKQSFYFYFLHPYELSFLFSTILFFLQNNFFFIRVFLIKFICQRSKFWIMLGINYLIFLLIHKV